MFLICNTVLSSILNKERSRNILLQTYFKRFYKMQKVSFFTLKARLLKKKKNTLVIDISGLFQTNKSTEKFNYNL